MLLKCECVNSTADVVHGRGIRPHVKLVPTLENFKLFGHMQAFSCVLCYYVRTKGAGMVSGKKTGGKRNHDDSSPR